MKNHRIVLGILAVASLVSCSDIVSAVPIEGAVVTKSQLLEAQAKANQEPDPIEQRAEPPTKPLAESQVVAPEDDQQAPEPTASNTSRMWNLKDVDIRTLINEVSKITGKDFVIAPEVQAKVTFIAHHDLTPDELYQAFLAVLRTNGFIAIPDGKIVKIVPDKSPDRMASPLVMKNLKKRGSETVVTAVRVNNYPATELVKVIKSLIPVYSYVEVYRPSNDLIIADRADNIVKIKELIKQVDKPATDRLEVIQLKNASAEDLTQSLTKLFSVGRDITSPDFVQLSFDDRTNSIIMSGGAEQTRKQIRSAISKLDGDYKNNRETLEVFYLRYIPAETVAPIVQGVVNNYLANLPEREKPKQVSTGAGGEISSTSSAPRTTNSQFNLQRPMSNYDSGLGGSLGSSSGGEGSSQVRSGLTFNAPRSGVLGPNIQWEESTNSLIVTGPAGMVQKVRQVLSKLDIRRPQVLIEVVIAEVGLDTQTVLGVEWSVGGNPQLHQRFASITPSNTAASSTSTSTADTSTVASTVTGPLGVLGSGLTFGVLRTNSLGVLIRALSADNRSNVLATPNLVTLDNQEATIKVGKKVSFVIGQINNNPTGGNPFNSFDREDVGLTLVIKPQITPDGEVKLLIQQELSSVIPNSGTPISGTSGSTNPDTTQRYINTTVMAKDGQTLVLAGLLQSDWALAQSKIPVLGDLPLVGGAFRVSQRVMRKTNLMIFMRPVILNDKAEADKVTQAKYEYTRQEQLKLDFDRSEPIVTPTLPTREVPNKSQKLPAPFMCGENGPPC